MATRTFRVAGMSCGHCVGSVESQVATVPGVAAVAVDLERGQVTVTADGPIDDAAVRAAVEEAGYEVTS